MGRLEALPSWAPNWTIFLLAGSFDIARQVAHKHDLGPGKWVMLTSEDQLRGLRGSTVWYCEGWLQTPDLTCILYELLQQRGILMAASASQKTRSRMNEIMYNRKHPHA